ncbi:MAG: hypothetical protein CO188_07535 [Zetaproteobacteria bacterium CG_4_9_14_3_um_filter_54_145]|nr:MAG: hypothetical protein COX55_05815 [Zetaproteobacteria bacterium CG23_combo_of_CG06-09_8_20_14_all_54_7]PIX54196.1 MAG: hypothetical protein COZ50_09145 [Zetaproteobacteria bacterium CG_4_10_14_3_um_filter_54_28]PJA29075.1 MAG: hypothetical protein CO188_07535 [Zetaproteobacteria bacterium CG_4_9_14_3_um_filter_54_145]
MYSFNQLFRQEFVSMLLEDIQTFGSFLINHHGIDQSAILEALELQRKQSVPFGRLAIEKRYLSVENVLRVLAIQIRSTKRFGEVAIELGLLNEVEVIQLLELQGEQRKKLGDILIDMKVFPSDKRDELLDAFNYFTEARDKHS